MSRSLKRPDALCPHCPSLCLHSQRLLWHSIVYSLPTSLECPTSTLSTRQGGEIYCFDCSSLVFSPLTDSIRAHAYFELSRRSPSPPPPLPFGLGLSGLVNLGSTCFMNSVLQCLLHVPRVKFHFLSGKHRERCERVKIAKGIPRRRRGPNAVRYASSWARSWAEQEEEKDVPAPFEEEEDVPACFGCELDCLLGGMNCPEEDVGTPMTAHRTLQHLWQCSRRLAGYYQQDAQEFYNTFVNAVHAHTCTCGTFGNLRMNGEAEPTSPSAASQRDGTLVCDCIVHSVLGGVLRSELECSECSMTSKRFEPFFDLPLELSFKRNSNKASTLLDCLDAFSYPERLIGNERVMCGRCDGNRDMSKRLSIHVVPQTIVFHLKRFESNFLGSTTLGGSGTGNLYPGSIEVAPSLAKNNSVVRFPVCNLDLAPYVSASCRCYKRQCECFTFDLHAVVQHSGELQGGHYVSYVKYEIASSAASANAPPIWFRFDDAYVYRVSQETVLDAEAYLLFYSRKQVM